MRASGSQVGIAVGAGVSSVLLGAAIGAGHAGAVTSLVLVGAGLALGLTNWRWSVYGLLVYLPFSGVATILQYPDTTPGVLAKDAIFVVPAYAGFFSAWAFRRQRIEVPGVPLVLLGLFSLLVVLQALNPSLPNHLTGLVGIKVWLFYIPLLAVGYHLVETKADVMRVLGLIVLAGFTPALIGIVEASLIYTGHGDAVYRLYGDAAAAVTQDFAEVGSLRRVPSTFSFVAQYFTFTFCMVAASYAWWQGSLARTRFAFAGAALWTLALVASFTTGARSAFLVVPLLVGLTLVLDRRRLASSLRTAALFIAGILAAVAIIGTSISAFVRHLSETVVVETKEVVIDGFTRALSVTWGGLGSGIDTNASRHLYERPDLFQAIGGEWLESWWVKALVELGIVGLVLVGTFFGSLVFAAVRRHARLRDPQLRSVSAAIVALLVTTLVANVKGPYIDFDPLNVLFWLLAGILFKLAVLDEPVEAKQPAARTH